jgi:hypothetical protein
MEALSFWRSVQLLADLNKRYLERISNSLAKFCLQKVTKSENVKQLVCPSPKNNIRLLTHPRIFKIFSYLCALIVHRRIIKPNLEKNSYTINYIKRDTLRIVAIKVFLSVRAICGILLLFKKFNLNYKIVI